MKKKPETPKWKRVLGVVGYGLFLIAIFVSATVAAWIKQSPLLWTMVSQQVGIEPREPKEVFKQDSLTLLILGCDQDLQDTYSQEYKARLKRDFLRTGERPKVSKAVASSRARADMILVAKLDFASNRITGVSIPRDLEVQLPGWRANKINSYYKNADPGEEKALMQAAVEYTLPGVKIDRVVVLDYDAFQGVVNMVGGVPVDIPKDLTYVDVGADLFIDLRKGRQVLDGYEAMGFVRIRHSDSDFERQKRQKELMVALKQQILKGSNLTSLPQILEQSKRVLGSALSDPEIGGLAGFAQKVPPENIKLGMIPILEKRGTTDLELDEEKLPSVLAEFNLLPSYHASGSSRL